MADPRPFVDTDRLPFARHVLMMDERGTWAGVDATELLASEEIVVAIIHRREQVIDLEGRFSYIGTCHWQGDFYVVLRVPDARDRSYLTLKYTTIPLGTVPRIHLPEENYVKGSKTPGVGDGA